MTTSREERHPPDALRSFERSVDEHKDKVFSFAYYYLGNQQEAEDITQEVLVKLWQHLPTLEGTSLGAWLSRVTRNAAFDQLRRRKRQRRMVDDRVESDDAARTVAVDSDPHSDAMTNEGQGRIRRLIAQLPEPYRSAILLREIQELKYREVAEILDLPTNTIKTHVHRGRRLLRELVLADGSPSTRHTSPTQASNSQGVQHACVS